MSWFNFGNRRADKTSAHLHDVLINKNPRTVRGLLDRMHLNREQIYRIDELVGFDLDKKPADMTLQNLQDLIVTIVEVKKK